jgi:hypothetical protein
MEISNIPLGMFINVGGAVLVSVPGIIQLEKCHSPGKLLRALEKLEADGIERGHCGFEELTKAINSIVEEEHSLDKNVYKLDIRADTTSVTKGAQFKVRAHTKEDGTRKIKQPLFTKMRYQLDRTIRRGETKIRMCGVCMMLIGIICQVWSVP